MPNWPKDQNMRLMIVISNWLDRLEAPPQERTHFFGKNVMSDEKKYICIDKNIFSLVNNPRYKGVTPT